MFTKNKILTNNNNEKQAFIIIYLSKLSKFKEKDKSLNIVVTIRKNIVKLEQRQQVFLKTLVLWEETQVETFFNFIKDGHFYKYIKSL